MMLIMMCGLKSFDDAAQELSVRIQVTVTSAHNFAAIGPRTPFVMHLYENRDIFAHGKPG
jgi:hypothetical protein